MSNIIINDLQESLELDATAMSGIRGGLTANVNNSQQANQFVTGAFGPVFAINSPVSSPSTILNESNPVTLVDLTTINMMNAAQNALNVF